MKNLFYLFPIFLLLSCSPKANCDHSNIESYEKITGIDIPEVLDVDCFQERKYRTSVFQLDTKALNANEKYKGIVGYIEHFKLRDDEQPIIINSIAVGRDLFAIFQKTDVYSKRGSSADYNWSFVLIPTINEIIVEVELK